MLPEKPEIRLYGTSRADGFSLFRAWVGQNNAINSQKAGQFNGLLLLVNGIYMVYRNDTDCNLSLFPILLSYFTFIFIGFP